MELNGKQSLKNEKNFINPSNDALQTILIYELQDGKLVEFLLTVLKIANLEAKYARYVLVTVSQLENKFIDRNQIQPYIYELILLGGIINKGKDTCLIKNGLLLEPGYLFDKSVIEKLVINAVNKIKKNGKLSEYIDLIESILAHQDIHKYDLAEIPYRIFLNTTYYQLVKEVVAYNWNYECALCTSKKNLQVHHRTYAHRGNEHLHMKDLILLCAECHCRQHGK